MYLYVRIVRRLFLLWDRLFERVHRHKRHSPALPASNLLPPWPPSCAGDLPLFLEKAARREEFCMWRRRRRSWVGDARSSSSIPTRGGAKQARIMHSTPPHAKEREERGDLTVKDTHHHHHRDSLLRIGGGVAIGNNTRPSIVGTTILA